VVVLMRRLKLILSMITIWSVCLSEVTYAQNENTLENHLKEILIQGYGNSFLCSYMQPFATAFGTATAGALFHRAYVKDFLRMDIGINTVYIVIPDKAKTFIFEGEDVPTFFGPFSSEQEAVSGSGLTSLYLSQIQLNLGLFANFEISIRGLNVHKIEEVGEMSLFGIGMKYDMTDLIPIPTFPIDMSVQALYQTYKISDWLEAGTFAMNIQLSKSIVLLPIDIYSGIGFEASALKIYTDKIPDIGENGIGDVEIDGENKLRMNFGFSLTVAIFNLHADYNLGKYNSLAAGIMLVF